MSSPNVIDRDAVSAPAAGHAPRVAAVNIAREFSRLLHERRERT